jgi:hypothetical protein
VKGRGRTQADRRRQRESHFPIGSPLFTIWQSHLVIQSQVRMTNPLEQAFLPAKVLIPDGNG